VLLAPLSAQRAPDSDVSDIQTRIRREASDRSQVLRTVHHLADVYGPRLTGSPSLRAAGEWAVATMTSWGLTGGRLEPFTFGYPGWVNERFSAHMLSPTPSPLVGEVVAWTPGTDGTVTASAFQLEIPNRPTSDELALYFEAVRDRVRGRIVLADRARPAPVTLTLPPPRRADEGVRARFGADAPEFDPPIPAGGGPGRRPGLTPEEIDRRLDEFLVASGALVRLNDARLEHGQVAAFHNPTYDVSRAVPTVVLRNEDYGRIARILADGTPVELEFTIVNRLHPEGRTAYNAIAEIEGTDLRDELVIIGAHLDSWQSATGATDNGVGCAVMMEAARILTAIGARPRRTIRVALWGGEEQGLLGSKAHVAQHFGTHENPRPAYLKLSAYLNLDHGTGRPRGAVVFGPPQAAAILRQVLAPLADLGVAGAVATRSRTAGTTDHTSFNSAGLPGIDFEQDPIQYDSHTHHTNLDTYERVLENDAIASAIVVATTAYELATRGEMLPRLSGGEMPAPGRP
jgi:hypothetical protein